MKASQHTWSVFYEKLAHLFYAVAISDNSIQPEEVNALHKMVLEDWLDLEESRDEFGTDMAFKIEAIFDLLRDRAVPGDHAFQTFEKYFHDNAALFTDDINRRIVETCLRIVTSFRDTNKSEMAMLFRVRLLLGKVEASS